MKEYDLKRLLGDEEYLDGRLRDFLAKGILRKERTDAAERRGHVEKAAHNLRFVQGALATGFLDWAVTGCYYACYHAALALIMTRGYASKNHLATLCVLIKEFSRKGLTAEDIGTLAEFLDYQDVLFYVESKNKREDAAYSSKIRFTKEEVETLRVKAVLFVSKLNGMVEAW